MSDVGNGVLKLAGATLKQLDFVQQQIFDQAENVESWFEAEWLATPPLITTSVDLRCAGFKLAPVDTNLFPAGFNNLPMDAHSRCVTAIQNSWPDVKQEKQSLLIIPENHTRNQYYLQSLRVMENIFSEAGFSVRIGLIEGAVSEEESPLGEQIHREGDRIGLQGYMPNRVLLNNDLSAGVPDILHHLAQPIEPAPVLGWATRLKSRHFEYYQEVATQFANVLNFDPWLINAYYLEQEEVDFVEEKGLLALNEKAIQLFEKIQKKYDQYGIKESPYIAVKANNGTYGMGVIMIQDPDELKTLNRKQRTRMAVGKGRQKVNKVILQEGVHSIQTVRDSAVAEPVVYMIGKTVVGGFYRIHSSRGATQNLNAPGMHFEPLIGFPEKTPSVSDYFYTVIARLAALAAAREMA